jgi:hypothetical protein
MAQADDAAVLARAKALANEDGFEWELDFGALGVRGAKLRGQHFLSKDRQQEYLERARAEFSQGTRKPSPPPLRRRR